MIKKDEIKNPVSEFYQDQIINLNKITSVSDVADAFENIKTTTEEFIKNKTAEVLLALKNKAIEELDLIVQQALDKLPNSTFKTELNNHYDRQLSRLQVLSDIDTIDDVTKSILDETKEFIKNLVVTTMKNYAKKLFDYDLADPYQYVPVTLRSNYSYNLINNPNNDYTVDTKTYLIERVGFGEQWQMFTENLDQLNKITNAMNVLDTSMAIVANAMNLYIENTASTTLDYETSNTDYTASLKTVGSRIDVKVRFNNAVGIPVVGIAYPEFIMAVDVATEKLAIYIYLNSENIIKYTKHNDLFELALTYGTTIKGQNVSRTSYFVTREENNIRTGEIYEYTTLNGSDKISASAMFTMDNNCMSVVGNKASGMVGFTGYINELYYLSNGCLVGYEVQEEKTIAMVTGTYHTLWFNIYDFAGIDSIKVLDKTDANTSSRSTVDVYLNGSNTLFAPTYNTKLMVKTSRKYDIELRSRFHHSLVDGDIVTTEVNVPMMFIQDDNNVDTNFTDFPTDIKAANGIDITLSMSQTKLSKIREDHATLIPIFKEKQNLMSSEQIISYLNSFN